MEKKYSICPQTYYVQNVVGHYHSQAELSAFKCKFQNKLCSTEVKLK